MRFPEDFTKNPHVNGQGGYQFLPTKLEDRIPISIIGGSSHHFGNGETTFEVYIGSEDNILQGGDNTGIYTYQSEAQVNNLIKSHVSCK